MEEYLAVMQTGLADNLAGLEARFDEETEGWTDEEREEAIQREWEDEFWVAHTVLPRHFYDSFVLTWYSYMEHQFFSVCRRLARNLGLESDLDEHKNDGITGYRTFYTRKANCQVDDNLWNEVMKVRIVRNALVHHGGKLTKLNQDLRVYLRKHNLMSSNGFDELYIRPEFCRHLIKLGRQFFEQIFMILGWLPGGKRLNITQTWSEGVTMAESNLQTRANKIARYCTNKALELLEGDSDVVASFAVKDLVFDAEGNLSREGFKSLDSLCRKGVYVFVNEAGVSRYVGQGGAGASTPLASRVKQEFKLFKKTKGGSNGGTLSKNIQDIDKVKFENEAAFISHIAGWRLRILHADSFAVSTELLEAFSIQLSDPRYNKRGKDGDLAR